MRRFVMFGAFVLLACVVATLVAVVWVDRALAAVKDSPDVLCLTSKDRQKIKSGDYPLDGQDTLVAKAINFDKGVPSIAWWHLRGAAIHFTYVTFWSPSRRAEEFSDLFSEVKDCSQQPKLG